ncbi:MAG: carbohydrate ABC transporter substrate-binding protein, partial [Hyphomicrobiales bacterium]|nr:carbohydrate ABC transporter substrate-binding protein [Hyphomicrobiales bacterium]
KADIAIPTTLTEFVQVLAQFDQVGILPFAHASEPWVDSILFESIALAVLGPDDYRQAFVKLDPKILTSAKMHQAFEQLRKISEYIDDDASGRTWEQATTMMMNGSAAMQIMGDWAKGDLTHAGKQPGKDFLCLPFPGTANSFSYNIDSFAFFKLRNASQEDLTAQNAFARTIMDPALQLAFNQKKGALPITNNADIAQFDSCSKRAYRDLQNAIKNDTLVPTFAQAMATTSYVQSAIASVVNNFIHEPGITSKTAV